MEMKRMAMIMKIIVKVAVMTFLSNLIFSFHSLDASESFKGFNIEKMNLIKCLDKYSKINDKSVLGERIKKTAMEYKTFMSKRIVQGAYSKEIFRKVSVSEYANCLLVPLKARLELIGEIAIKQENYRDSDLEKFKRDFDELLVKLEEVEEAIDAIIGENQKLLINDFKKLESAMDQKLEKMDTKISFYTRVTETGIERESERRGGGWTGKLNATLYKHLKIVHFSVKEGEKDSSSFMIDINGKDLSSVIVPFENSNGKLNENAIKEIKVKIKSFLQVYAFSKNGKNA